MVPYQDVDGFALQRNCPGNSTPIGAGHPPRPILNYTKHSVPGLDLPGVVEAMFVNDRVPSTSTASVSFHTLQYLFSGYL